MGEHIFCSNAQLSCPNLDFCRIWTFLRNQFYRMWMSKVFEAWMVAVSLIKYCALFQISRYSCQNSNYLYHMAVKHWKQWGRDDAGPMFLHGYSLQWFLVQGSRRLFILVSNICPIHYRLCTPSYALGFNASLYRDKLKWNEAYCHKPVATWMRILLTFLLATSLEC